MGSSAFLLPIHARGLYREMLTQSWRRGAKLPSDFEMIRRAVGVTLAEWDCGWPLISHFWHLDSANNLINDTQVEVYAEAKAGKDRAVKRAQVAAQASAQVRAQAALKQSPPSPSPSPSLSPSQSPTPTPVLESKNSVVRDADALLKRTNGSNGNGHPKHFESMLITAKEREHAKAVRKQRGGCKHTSRCNSFSMCVDRMAIEFRTARS